MCGVLLVLHMGLKGRHLIRVVLLLLVHHCTGGEGCDYLPCSHVGGVLCHIHQSHIPRPTANVLILIHWVEEGMVGPAQQAVNTTLRSMYTTTVYNKSHGMGVIELTVTYVHILSSDVVFVYVHTYSY